MAECQKRQEQERWDRFAHTGRVEDYLLYRSAQNAARAAHNAAEAADTAPVRLSAQEGGSYAATVDHRRADPAGK